MSIFLKFLKKQKYREYFFTCYEACIALIPKPETTAQENYRPLALVNTKAKIFCKVLANKT